MLRDWFDSSAQKGATLVRFLINQILDKGLEPTTPPLPLTPIEKENIELLCWMGRESNTAVGLPLKR